MNLRHGRHCGCHKPKPCGCHKLAKQIVHPVKENVVHCCTEETVKHIHPSHTTVMNHHLIKNEHVFPHSTSVGNTVSEVDVFGGAFNTPPVNMGPNNVGGAMSPGMGGSVGGATSPGNGGQWGMGGHMGCNKKHKHNHVAGAHHHHKPNHNKWC